jgi:hypothetical protein
MEGPKGWPLITLSPHKEHVMTPQTHERSISTMANVVLDDGHGQKFNVHRELVMQENKDGNWLVYVVLPETADGTAESIVSDSVNVTEGATSQFLGELFSLLADPYGSGTARDLVS